ncbi:MAG: TolC family protein [Candidatus Omnitrophota bacterium]
MKKILYFLSIFLLFMLCPLIAFSADITIDKLSVEEYLGNVGSVNGAYSGSLEKREGSKDLEREADLIFSPSFFTNVEVGTDEGQPYGFLYDKSEWQRYSSGFSMKTPYGFQGKLYYDFEQDRYQYPGQTDKYTIASPVLEVSLPLWKNCFGRSDRANEEAVRAQAQADAWNAEDQRKTLLVNAEIAYWQLAITREVVDIQKRGLDESQAIYDYVKKRAEMNLTDQADVLQAKADLESKKLDLKSAKDDEAIALRILNKYSNTYANDNAVVLRKVDWDKIADIPVPDKYTSRADVRAAEANARVAEANARIKVENNKPSLDLYADYELNGGSADSSDAFGDSFSTDNPTIFAGVKFSVPLDFSASSDARKGGRQLERAAKLIYQQKLRDQESDWRNLIAKLNDARERLKMSFTIEAAQKEKLEYERDRLKHGRTTTYQVLLFEQDYLQAEYTRAKAAYEILSLVTQINLYQDDSPIYKLVDNKGKNL